MPRGKEYEPTDRDRQQIKLLSAMGVPDYDIAKVMSLAINTMRKYFLQELQTGHIEANAKVAQSLFKQATDSTSPKSVTAAIFWLKCRAGWREEDNKEYVGKKQEQMLAADEAVGGRFAPQPPPTVTH
jgi:hypothetical protein